jgi:hypothetical protein
MFLSFGRSLDQASNAHGHSVADPGADCPRTSLQIELIRLRNTRAGLNGLSASRFGRSASERATCSNRVLQGLHVPCVTPLQEGCGHRRHLPANLTPDSLIRLSAGASSLLGAGTGAERRPGSKHPGWLCWSGGLLRRRRRLHRLALSAAFYGEEGIN